MDLHKYWKIPLSWLLHALGHLVSLIPYKLYWHWPDVAYQWLMQHSSELDEWDMIWKTVDDDD